MRRTFISATGVVVGVVAVEVLLVLEENTEATVGTGEALVELGNRWETQIKNQKTIIFVTI